MGNSTVAARSAETEMMDFSKVSTPEKTDFLKLGHYWLNVAEAKFEQPLENNSAGTQKTAFLEVVFRGEKGQVTEKFYVSPKEGLIKRLQYLHFALTGKECVKPFKSIAECGKYYETLLNDSRITSKKLAMIVGGEEYTNKSGGLSIKGKLPYLHFIIDSDVANKSGFEEGAFEEGSSNWNNFLKKQEKNASHTTDAVHLPDSSRQVPDNDGDMLPF